RIEVDGEFWKKILRESWVFAMLTIIAVFYMRMGIVVINNLKGPYYTGIYSSAFKFLEATLLIPQSFALALFPQTARLLNEDKKRVGKNYIKSLGLIFLFSAFYTLIFWFFSPQIIKISYGKNYLGGVETMKGLGLVATLFFLNALPGNIIQNTPLVKDFVWWLGGKFILHLGLCLLLIPKFSLVGAVLALGISEFFGFLTNNGFVIKILRSKNGRY
ncbi:MAG: oligosaccharide flippase family protein, partial [Microgenomates group bacterium]